MKNDRHSRLGDLFLTASELTAGARERYLDEACVDDRALRDEVAAMLRAEDEAGEELEKPAVGIDVVSMTHREDLPSHIGGYEVLRTLGEGGMGVVYEARQENPDRTVALKVLRRVEDKDSLRRFEHEAQVLGWLQHPAIAHVYEAGVAVGDHDERPYFAMELVDGLPIDTYANGIDLGVEERLILLTRVAQGVRHAHQKGVVHRDLKPANILVQSDGQPKILDFGIARVAPQDGEEQSMLTQAGDVVGTLAYMSPEQIRADPRDIDTQSDVYALGVLSYELLSGRRPIQTGGVPLPQAMQRILDEEPMPLGEVAPDVPEDVATIVHKALAKDRGRRYASVEAFTDDIERFLRREPIQARPASAVYKVKRFVQRHRGATLGVAATAVALILGTVASTTLFLREQSALEAERETSSALALAQIDLEGALRQSNDRLALLRRTNRHFERLLAAPLPGEDGAQVKMVDVLRRAANETEEAFEDNPEQRAWLCMTLSTTFAGIGLYEDALEIARRGQVAVSEIDGVDPITESQSHSVAARSLVELRRYDEAESEIEAGLAFLEGVEGDAAAAMRVEFHYHRALGCFDQKDIEGANAALDLAQAELESCDDVSPVDRAGLTNLRIETLWSAGAMEAGEELSLQSIADLEAQGRGDSIAAHLMRNNLSAIYYNSGRAREAIPLMRSALEGTRRQVGDDHEFIAKQAGNLATILRQNGQMEEALTLYTDALDVSRRVFNDGHPSIAQTLALRGSLYLDLDLWEQGEADLEEALSVLAGQSDPSASITRAMAQGYLSPALRHRGEVEEAERLLVDAIAIKKNVMGTEMHPMLLYDMRELSNCAKDREAYDEMFDWGMRALEITLRFEGPDSPASKGLVDRLEDAVRLMDEQDEGSGDAAVSRSAERRAKLDEALGR